MTVYGIPYGTGTYTSNSGYYDFMNELSSYEGTSGLNDEYAGGLDLTSYDSIFDNSYGYSNRYNSRGWNIAATAGNLLTGGLFMFAANKSSYAQNMQQQNTELHRALLMEKFFQEVSGTPAEEEQA